MAASVIEFPSNRKMNAKPAPISLMRKVQRPSGKTVVAVTHDPQFFNARFAHKWYAASAT